MFESRPDDPPGLLGYGTFQMEVCPGHAPLLVLAFFPQEEMLARLCSFCETSPLQKETPRRLGVAMACSALRSAESHQPRSDFGARVMRMLPPHVGGI